MVASWLGAGRGRALSSRPRAPASRRSEELTIRGGLPSLLGSGPLRDKFARRVLGPLVIGLAGAGSTNCSCDVQPPVAPVASPCDTKCPSYSISDSENYELKPY